MERFHCVELLSDKSELTHYTRWGAAKRCHDLNKWNPNERWTVKSRGEIYIPNYAELLHRRKHGNQYL